MSAPAWQYYLLVNAVIAAAYVAFRFAESCLEAHPSTRLRRGRLVLGAALLLTAVALLLPGSMTPRWSNAPAKILQDFGSPRHDSNRSPAMRPEPAHGDTVVSAPAPEPFAIEEALLVLLLFGFCGALARLIYRWLEVGDILNEAVVVHRLRRFRVAVSNNVTVPFAAYRFRTSWVVLPAAAVEHARDFRLSLRHEVQHIRQRDTHWTVALELLGTALFLNPFVRHWRTALGDLQELSCDARLVGQRGVSPREYIGCLLRVAEAALESPRLLAGTTSMAGPLGTAPKQRSFLRRRIEMLTKQLASHPPRAGRLAGTLLIATVALFTLAARGLVSDSNARNPGEVVVLDDLQAIAESALQKSMEANAAEGGFAIIAEPSTGRILAVADKDRRPGRTADKYWSLSQPMRPASLVKPLVLAAALEGKKTRLDETYSLGDGTYRWEGVDYRDWKGFGKITAAEIISNSSNIGAIKIAQRVGEDSLLDTFARFGFGKDGSTARFPRASAGRIVPEPSATPSLRLALLATGGGIETTPLEIVAAYGAIANGGRLLRPVTSNQKGNEEMPRAISEDTSQRVRKAMTRTMIDGTARESASAKYSMAGKTCSAQDPSFGATDGDGNAGNVACFVGFAPVDSPKVLVYVGVIRPTKGDGHAHGSTHAAPVVREIIERTFAKWGVVPDKT